MSLTVMDFASLNTTYFDLKIKGDILKFEYLEIMSLKLFLKFCSCKAMVSFRWDSSGLPRLVQLLT